MTADWALQRLRQLREEYADCESQLLQIERHRTQVQDAILRLAGAIQVLEELIAESGAFDAQAEPVPTSAP